MRVTIQVLRQLKLPPPGHQSGGGNLRAARRSGRADQGRGGVFDVTADGVLVYSERLAGRFSDNEEVLQALKGRSA